MRSVFSCQENVSSLMSLAWEVENVPWAMGMIDLDSISSGIENGKHRTK